MKQLQDLLRRLSGELLDMACCQADLAVRLDEEGSGKRNGRWKTLGDGAGFKSHRDPVSPEERYDSGRLR